MKLPSPKKEYYTMYTELNRQTSMKESADLLSRVAESSKIDRQNNGSIKDPLIRAKFATAYAKVMRDRASEKSTSGADAKSKVCQSETLFEEGGFWIVVAALASTLVAGVGYAAIGSK